MMLHLIVKYDANNTSSNFSWLPWYMLDYSFRWLMGEWGAMRFKWQSYTYCELYLCRGKLYGQRISKIQWNYLILSSFLTLISLGHRNYQNYLHLYNDLAIYDRTLEIINFS